MIWKSIVREPLTEHDIASFDLPACTFVQHLASIYKRLLAENWSPNQSQEPTTAQIALVDEAQAMLQDLNWTAVCSDGRIIELIPGGESKPVLLADIEQYLRLFVEARLGESSIAIEAFREGFVMVIPESAIALLTWEELHHLVCGAQSVDIQRLRENTEYDDDVGPDDAHIINFWQVLEEFSEEEKSAFLRFVWARPTLPPKGVPFPQKLKVQSAVGDDVQLKPDQYLPRAHTCFFSVNLPRYSTKELMAEKLRYAISNCTEMDADFRLTDSEISGWSVLPQQGPMNFASDD